uniref:Sensory neuron membrane protein 2 n=1 Tax=Colaphellus bowringi TaxID=561076 RepID=A0A0S3J3E6_9CUCU|nr:sensory neuron membrane protein SNMP2 [Colaphellus bowringi]
MKMFGASRFCNVKILFVTTVVATVVLIGVLLLSFVGMPLIVNDQLAKKLRLENNTEQWDRFVELPVPLNLNVFVFNVTNSDEVTNNKATPILQEIGPYCYEERITRKILSANSTEDSITYEQSFNITFDEKRSGQWKESDKIVMVNPLFLILSQITNVIERFVVMGCIDKLFPPKYSTMFFEVDIKTIMLEGIEFGVASDDIGPACNIVRNKLLEKTLPMKNVERIPSPTDPSVINSLKFAFLQYKIRGPDGQYTTNRGIDDITQLGHIMRWDHSAEIDVWGRGESTNNATCKEVKGSDSTIYPPHVTKSTKLDIFSTDICRTVQIRYKGTGTYQGDSGYYFGIDENTFRPATPSPENDCYCIQQTMAPDGEPSCFLDGVVDVYPCFGAPILLSFPHFLYADESYLDGVIGIDPPNSSIHEIFLLIEPNTGTPLQGMKRIQLNVVLRPVEFVEYTANLPSTVLPLIWIEEGVNLSQDLLDKLDKMYFNVIKAADAAKYAAIGVLTAFVLISGGFFVRKRYFK